MLTIITLFAPWVCAGYGAVLAVRRLSPKNVPAILIFGMGSALGYLLLSHALVLANRVGISLLSDHLHLPAAILSITVLGFCLKDLKTSATDWGHIKSPITFLLVCISGIYLTWQLALLVTMPAQGWDVLDFWARIGFEYIEHSTNPSSSTSYIHQHRHPPTLGFLIGWSGWLQHQSALSASLFAIPWFLVGISASMALGGWAFFFFRSLSASLFSGCSIFMVPLFENHIVWAGYSEIFVAVFFMFSLMSASLYIALRQRFFLILAIFFAVELITLRNTGVLYCAVLLLSMAIFFLAKIRRRYAAIALVIICTAVYSIYYFGIYLEFFGFKFGFHARAEQLFFAGKRLEVLLPPVNDLARTVWFALVSNSSFSLFFFAPPVCALIMLAKRGANHCTNAGIFWLTFISYVFGLTAVCLGLFTKYGFDNAVPGHDISFSRALLPVVMTAPLAVVALLSALSPNHNISRRTASLVVKAQP